MTKQSTTIASATAGALAGAMALAAGEFVGGLAAPTPGPVTAVANRVIDNAPGWFVDFGKNLFGLSDKPALILGTILLSVILASGLGMASRRRRSVGVTGIGPKVALSLLSSLSDNDLRVAVATGDVTRLSKVPDIAKKTAERLMLELKGKLGPELALSGRPAADDSSADVMHALLALGYSEREVATAVKQIGPDVGVSEGIKQALKQLARS